MLYLIHLNTVYSYSEKNLDPKENRNFIRHMFVHGGHSLSHPNWFLLRLEGGDFVMMQASRF